MHKMTEENKQEKAKSEENKETQDVKEQKPQDEAQEKKPETKKEEPPAEKPAKTKTEIPPKKPAEEDKKEQKLQAEAGSAKKRIKINKMSLEQIEAKINEAKEKMGGLASDYIKQLIKQKDILLNKNKE